MKGVAIVQEKGGMGKTTLCHLLALGAVPIRFNDSITAPCESLKFRLFYRVYRYTYGRVIHFNYMVQTKLTY